MSKLRRLALPTPPLADEVPVRPTKARTAPPAPEPAPTPDSAGAPAFKPPSPPPPSAPSSFAVDDDPLFREMTKISEASTGTSSFEQFLPGEYKKSLAASRAPARSEDDEHALKLIRGYRDEFGKDLAVPKDEVLEAMTSDELQGELARCRGGVSKGVTKEMVAGTYFAFTKTAEASAPAFGVHLFGLTEALKQSKVVDDCLRCATVELRATVTGQIPWYYALPLATVQAGVELHFAHEAEDAARKFLSKPLPRKEISPPQNVPVSQRGSSQAVAPRTEGRPNAPSGDVGVGQDNFSKALAAIG